MALVIDATVGGVNSNSYLTVARASELAGQLPHMPEWHTNIYLNKAQLLVHATRLVDRYGYFYGSKRTQAQRLSFPRSGLSYYPDGDSIPDNIIPEFIEWATIEWAFFLINNSDSNPSESQDIRSLRTPSYSIEFRDPSQSKRVREPDVISDLLRPYTRRVGMNYARVLRT